MSASFLPSPKFNQIPTPSSKMFHRLKTQMKIFPTCVESSKLLFETIFWELKLVCKQRQRRHYCWDNTTLSKKEKVGWMVYFARVSISGKFTLDVLQQNLVKTFFTKLSYSSQTCLFHRLEPTVWLSLTSL